MRRGSYVVLTLAFVAAASAARGQDPLKLLPDSYKLQFENEWVRVTRVHYAPQSKLPAHAHTTEPSAYVYLNDAGPVIFRHIGLAYGAIGRPATVARAFRLFKNVREIHEVENPNDTPSDFLRVEFKTEPLGEATLRGRFYPEPYPAGENFVKVQFENEQIRVSRRACAVGRSCDLSPSSPLPGLLVALTGAAFDGEGADGRLAAGDTRWVASDAHRVIRQVGPEAAEFLVFEFKTRPLPAHD